MSALQKIRKKCTNKSRKEFDFWLIVLLYNDYNIGVTRKNLTKPLWIKTELKAIERIRFLEEKINEYFKS